MGTRIRIVPNVTPNAEGKWITVDAEMPFTPSRWVEIDRFFASYLPHGYHLVQTGDASGSEFDV